MRGSLPAAVLFDRDGTLVVDVPYNRDPDQVRPMPHAAAALDRVRRAGVPIAVVTNQSGVARGLITPAELAAVNRRVAELLGPIDVWEICPHDESAGCPCRKPRPGLILRAARRLGVVARDCVVIGDIGRDVEAAARAGARGILVPTPVTRAAEVAAAPETAPDLAAAVALALGDAAPGPYRGPHQEPHRRPGQEPYGAAAGASPWRRPWPAAGPPPPRPPR